MPDIKASVQGQFQRAAESYRTSQVHAQGEDLDLIRQLVTAHMPQTVLDAGCGAGHTAMIVAPLVRDVVAYDLTPGMLVQVEALALERGLANVHTRQGDVEAMPFDDASFDMVVTRYSAHHWPNPLVALQECARVLRPGGRLIVSDIVAPEDAARDTFLQTIELLRDPSHVRDHSVSQWKALLASAGFKAEVVKLWPLTLDFDDWVARINTPALNIEMLKALFDGASSEISSAMQIQPDYRFTIYGALLQAVKQG
jgi:ubiquinone/menaquinone biosynthesis C-methylase UbiE